MTTFRVGQRVRVAWVHKPINQHKVGKEFVISTLYSSERWGLCTTLLGDTGFLLTTQIEPLSDSNTLVSWESMRGLWVPDDMREVA